MTIASGKRPEVDEGIMHAIFRCIDLRGAQGAVVGVMAEVKDEKSPFFDKTRVLENEVAFVIRDGFPVSEGHCLIVPKRVFADYFDATQDEMDGLQQLLIATKQLLDKEFSPDGYNVGINCGEHAGQTVPHVHIHLIPRYQGDMDNPRGGVRGVIPSKQKY